MIKISTKKFNPNNWPAGVWGTYAPGAQLKVRKMTSEILRELRRPFVHQEMELDKKSGAMVPVDKISPENNEKYNDVLIDFVLEDHKGFGDDDGNPFPSPLDLMSKKALFNELSVGDWVWGFSRRQEIASDEKKEAEIKN